MNKSIFALIVAFAGIAAFFMTMNWNFYLRILFPSKPKHSDYKKEYKI